MTAGEPATIATAVLAALDGRRQCEPFTDRFAGFTTASAYAVTEQLRRLRVARGERPVGRKIGFTNRGIWEEYAVAEPIWGDMFDTTVHPVEPGRTIVVSHLCEPRIEPELVLGIERDLTFGMTPSDIAASIGWVAHGFEIVQSIFPGWRFRVADCVADGGLHGALFLGPKLEIGPGMRHGLARRLSEVSVALYRGGSLVATGQGANALDGPIEALAYLVKVLADDRHNPPLRAGEMVTTGTLTPAYVLRSGEKWATQLDGIDLPGLSIEIA